MGRLRFGMHINVLKPKGKGKKLKYLRFSAGTLKGQYVHRVILAAKIGRDLTADETADHEDGDTLNNHPTNIIGPISWAEHGRITRRREKERKEAALKEKLEREKENIPF